MTKNLVFNMSVSLQFIKSTEYYKNNIIINDFANNEQRIIEKVLEEMGADLNEGYSTFEALLRVPQDLTRAYVDTIYRALTRRGIKHAKLFLDIPIAMSDVLEPSVKTYSISDLNSFYKKYEVCESISLTLNQGLDENGEVALTKVRRKVRLPKYKDEVVEE